jgi:RND family efflux transporter MFP subunit
MRIGKQSWCLVVGSVLLAVLAGCRREAPPPALPVAVRVTALKREPITSETRFSATVRERKRIEMSFKVPGTVAELLQVKGIEGEQRNVHEGDVVTSEQMLARLDDSDYQRRVAVAEERLAQAKAKERAVMANVIAARATFERIKALRASQSVAQQNYDETLAKKDAVEAELEATRREIRAGEVGLEQAEDDLKNCQLRVPIPTAIVSRKYIEGNERVPGGQPVFQIMDLTHVRVAFGVPDTKVGQFQFGQKVSVMADAFPNEHFTGEVTRILPAADLKTRTFEIEVTINEPKGLRPGMVVTIIVGRREEMVLLPMTAVQRGDSPNELVVYRVVDENGQKVARKRQVTLDGIYDNRIRLVEGDASAVGVGDMVVVTGTFRLIDGQAVRLLELQDPLLHVGL